MRAREIIKEAKVSVADKDTMPATYVIPALKNQDAYLQYRFSGALAGAKGAKQRAMDGVQEESAASELGENEIVVGFDASVAGYIDDALKSMGMSPSDKKLVSTPASQEPPNTNIVSPVAGFAGYKRK